MHELYPEARYVVDLEAEISVEVRTAPKGRPYVLTNMVSSADGATALGGLSGDLAGPPDSQVFMAFRAIADVIIAGASTVRAERYRPPQTPPEVQAQRVDRGQQPKPMIAVVTASAKLDPALPLFSDPDFTPLILTGEDAPADRLEALSGKATIIRCGQEGVDLSLGLRALSERGFETALLEGGPTLNGQFHGGDFIDEWNLTLAPVLVGGDAKRAAQGTEAVARGFGLQRVWLDDDLLFLQWRR